MRRLNQWLVQAGAAPSRRKADELITDGQVRVSGVLAEVGQVVEDDAVVELEGRILQLQEVSQEVILLHKPRGYLCSHHGQGGDKTIFQLLPPEYTDWKLIGRLDKDSEGLVVLSNDGAYVQQLSHPSGGHLKRYKVLIDRGLDQGERWQLEAGVPLAEGMSYFLQLEVNDTWLELSLRTGWNRQIRRTLGELGVAVRRLVRLQLGPYELGDLPAGEWRMVRKQV